jgi:hypothetical protein
MLKRYTNNGNTLVLVDEITQPALASAQAVLGECIFSGLLIQPDGVNEVTVNVYDNTEASGNRLLPSDVKVNGANGLWTIGFYPGIDVNNGIYIELAVAGGGSAEYQVLYAQGGIG